MQKIYAFSDPNDFEFDSDFVDFSSGKAKLKIAQSEDSYPQSFANDSGFTYDSDLAEFIAGVLRQKDQRPANALLGASYSSSVNASWAQSGSLTGTPNNGASVSGGKLVLTGGGNKSVDYNASGRVGILSGAMRFRWTPNYNGAPVDTQQFFTLCESEGSNNSMIQIMHHSNGSLFLYVNDGDGNNIYSNSLLTFDAVAGQESVIELGWDLSGGGKFYVFGQGFLLAELDGTFSRNDCAFLRVGGSDAASNVSIDDLITFGQNIHTATHDPEYSVPDNIYLESAAIIPEMAYNAGDGTFLEATDLATDDTNDPRFTIQIGRSGNYLYWNGSAWVTSNGSFAQANTVSTFNTNISSLPVDGEIYAQITVHFSTSNTQQSINTLALAIIESTVYTTTAQKIIPQGRFQAETLISFLNSVLTPADTFIKYILEVDSVEKYWNGSIWKSSNGSFAQSNTKQEVEDHIVGLLTNSSYVKLISYLKTDDESSTPELTSATIDYAEDVEGVRGYLNSVLAFIGAESLTDEEFETITLENIDDLVANYEALLGILESRDAVSEMTARLQYYYMAQGVQVVPASLAQSNIFVGGAL